MANIPYDDDSIVYNPEEEVIYFHDKKMPLDKDMVKRAREQLEAGNKLASWLAIENDDINKIMYLYPIMDSELSYDLLCNRDKYKLALELLQMSRDNENFEDMNRSYFSNMSNYIIENLGDNKKFIDEERDLKLESLVEEFFSYNYTKFQDLEQNEGKSL